MFNPQLKPEKGSGKKRGFKPNLDAIYSILQKRKLAEHPNCQIKLDGCKGKASEVHHKAGRKTWRLVYFPWFLSTCRVCHTWVTEHSKQAIALGHSLSINTKKPDDADDYLK